MVHWSFLNLLVPFIQQYVTNGAEIFINTAQLFLWKIYRPRSLWVRNLRKIKQTNKKKKTVHMKQYSSNGCNIFAFNILVKDGYDGILRQYEVLCTRDAVTCITCRRTWSSTVQVKSRYYHSHYNSFTAWPQRHEFTFNFSMQSCKRLQLVNQSRGDELSSTPSDGPKRKTKQKNTQSSKYQPFPLEALSLKSAGEFSEVR